MKRSLVLICLSMLMTPLALANPDLTLTEYLQSAKSVYFAQVVSNNRDGVTFTITQVLRGKTISSLVVPLTEGLNQAYDPKSEWLLVSNSHGVENTIGWSMTGDRYWIPGIIVRRNGEIRVTDGRKELTLDDVRELLKQSPAKP